MGSFAVAAPICPSTPVDREPTTLLVRLCFRRQSLEFHGRELSAPLRLPAPDFRTHRSPRHCRREPRNERLGHIVVDGRGCHAAASSFALASLRLDRKYFPRWPTSSLARSLTAEIEGAEVTFSMRIVVGSEGRLHRLPSGRPAARRAPPRSANLHHSRGRNRRPTPEGGHGAMLDNDTPYGAATAWSRVGNQTHAARGLRLRPDDSVAGLAIVARSAERAGHSWRGLKDLTGW